jgi:cytochrome b6-f complex iron-sulfur subunit
VAHQDDERTVPLTRRTFVLHSCEAATLAALATILQGCGDNPTSPSTNVPSLSTITGTVANGVVSVSIDAGSPLASVNSAALVQSSGGSFLVARTGQTTFTAVTAVCTHEGCIVSGFENQTYVCPCHGSRYATTGAVVNGPATAALRQFATQFSGTILTITL